MKIPKFIHKKHSLFMLKNSYIYKSSEGLLKPWDGFLITIGFQSGSSISKLIRYFDGSIK